MSPSGNADRRSGRLNAKGGVVRDPNVHQRVCEEAATWVASQGWTVVRVTPSPITGPEGNVEFLLGAVKDG